MEKHKALRSFLRVLLLAVLVAGFPRPAAAELAEPSFLVYGRASMGGTPLPAGSRIELEVGGAVLASYVMRSNPELGDLYALRVPLDTVGNRLPGHARSGDSARIFFATGQLAAVLPVGEAGGTRALDLDPAALAAGIVAGDAAIFEGDAGTTTVQVPISLTQVSPVAVEVDFITRDGSAASSSDYTPRLGRAVIPAGQTQVTVAIQIAGDTAIESDETFFVDLSSPLGGILLDPEGQVTVLDDDTPPAISISDATTAEPNPGASQQLAFTVRLSHVWDAPVSVSYAAFSPPGGAINGTDFVLNAGSLTFPPGQVTREIQVQILGDLVDEGDETFEVRLANPVQATLGDGVGLGTISDYVRILRYLEQHVEGVAGTGSAPGLAGAFDLAFAPGGDQLYVAGRAGDALVVFDRGADGTLSHLATYKNGENGIRGLNGVEAVRVSRDGTRVFAAAFDDNAVASFARLPDGTLQFVEAEFDSVLDADSGRTVNGLAGATALAEVPGATPADPDHLYVTGLLDNAVAVFSILADGGLRYETAARDGVFGANGLSQAAAIAVADNGTDVYVAGYGDDSVALFTRNPQDGFLTFRQILVEGSGGVFGLDGALDVAISPDQGFVYVAGQGSNAIAAFRRNPANGFLTFLGSVADGIDGVDGLRQVTGLAFSHHPSHGDYLYASSYGDNAVAIFARQANGTLLFVEQVRDGVAGVDGIQGANALIASAEDQNVYVAGSGESKLAVFGRDIVAPPPVPTLLSTSHTLGVPSALGTLAFRWAGATDPGYGVGRYWLAIDATPDTPAPPAAPSLGVPHGSDPHSASLPSPGDSDRLYLHLTSCDLIGNCSPTHLGPFVVDTTAPAPPGNLASSSHAAPSSAARISASWSIPADVPAPSGYASGLGGFRYQLRPTAAPSCAGATSLPVSATAVRSGVVAVGDWFFHICSADQVGNLSSAAVLGPLTVLPDTVPPQVARLDSVARSADGRVAAGETLGGAVTQLLFRYSEPVAPAGAGDLASFRVYAPGANGLFETTGCGAPAGDDQPVALAGAAYDDDLATSALRLAGSLGRGSFRAVACAGIRDLRDNPLGGGSGYSLDFAAAGNILANPNFDQGIAGWSVSDPQAAFAPADADGQPSSGALVFRVSGGAESAEQCLEAAALASLEGFAGLRGALRITDHTPTTAFVRAELVFHAAAGCSGSVLGTLASSEAVGDGSGNWHHLGIETAIPAGTLSATARFVATPLDPATDSDVELDRTALQLSALFADGFESGDTSGWSLTQP